MSTWSLISDRPVHIDSYELEGLELQLGGDFTRLTTVITLHGNGETGIGEDVTYDALDHVAQQDAGPFLRLAGDHTLASFSELLGGLDMFPTPPEREVSRAYRQWGFESAALDLALRQAGIGIEEALGREARPLTFVNSMRLGGFGGASSIEPLTARLELYPGLRFKLDPANDWDDELIAALAATGAVDSLDLKGHYKGTPVDVETDPELYRKLLEAFPDAWIEDPDVNEETRPILKPHADRVTWDAPIHAIADIVAAPWKPKMVNIKPSRVGSLKELFDSYDYCADNGIRVYGGGQTELGPGRGHIQALAALFHPDTPNDVAPREYNEPGARSGLPESPLAPNLTPTGFRWAE